MRTAWTIALLAALAAGAAPAAAQVEGVAVGTRVAPMQVHDLDGRPVDLGAYVGRKPVLLEFWATWCGQCEALLPKVRAAQAKYGDRVEFIGVNIAVNQTPARVRRYVEKEKPPFRTLYDDEGTTSRAFDVPTTSYVVVLDRTGTVVYTGSGAEQDLDAALAAAL